VKIKKILISNKISFVVQYGIELVRESLEGEEEVETELFIGRPEKRMH
jgi:hypothetical protein